MYSEDDEYDNADTQHVPCGEKCRRIRGMVEELEFVLKEDCGRRAAGEKAKAEKREKRRLKKKNG